MMYVTPRGPVDLVLPHVPATRLMAVQVVPETTHDRTHPDSSQDHGTGARRETVHPTGLIFAASYLEEEVHPNPEEYHKASRRYANQDCLRHITRLLACRP